MNDKPGCLGLLNAIAVGEARGYELLTTWAKATPSPDLRTTLEFVALREAEHAAVFRKRLSELGFGVREQANAKFDQDLVLARSSASDQEKFGRLVRTGSEVDKVDPLGRIFEDTTIDPETGALLGRFIAEERDSERRLQAACSALNPEGPVATAESPVVAGRSNDETLLSDIFVRLDRLTETLQTLKSLRSR